jgi:hypothetical protein
MAKKPKPVTYRIYQQRDGRVVKLSSAGEVRRLLADGRTEDPQQIPIPDPEPKEPAPRKEERDLISHQGTYGANRYARPGMGCLPIEDAGNLCGACAHFELAKGNVHEGYCSLYVLKMKHLQRKGKVRQQPLIPVSAVAGPDFAPRVPQAAE